MRIYLFSPPSLFVELIQVTLPKSCGPISPSSSRDAAPAAYEKAAAVSRVSKASFLHLRKEEILH